MTMRKGLVLAAVAAPLALGGCADMNRTQQNTLSGGAIGAGVGAVGAAVTGGVPLAGAAIGAAAGSAAGYIKSKMEEK